MSHTKEIISLRTWITIGLRMLFLPISMVVILLWPAGDWRWMEGWLVIVAYFSISLVAILWLAKSKPDIIIERLKGHFQEGQSGKDSVIVAILSIVMLSIFPVAGFDYRFSWYQLGLIWKVMGLLMLLVSLWILYHVFSENIYLSRSIVVQGDRKHSVVKTGPYALVRHPMYSAIMVMVTGTVLILGSGIAFIPSIISYFILFIRAILEEDLLENELDGYDEYKTEVSYRLIPGIL